MRPSRLRTLGQLACATALLAGLGVGDPPRAAAEQQSVTVKSATPDPDRVDPALGGPPAWTSASIAMTAKRMPDGRLGVQARATVVARRGFQALLTVDACSAAQITPPAGFSPSPYVTYTYRGQPVVRTVQVRKGVNHLTASGVVDVDGRWTVVRSGWTDCAKAGLVDAKENDAKAIAKDRRILKRSGTSVFSQTPGPAVLSFSMPGAPGQPWSHR